MQFKKIISRIPLHVLLIAIYPALLLYQKNIDELPNDIFVRPCIYSSIFSILLFTLIYCSCKHINKSGIITSFFLILFFTYGHIESLLQKWGWKNWMVGDNLIGVNDYLAPLYLIVLLFGLNCFRKMHGGFTNITIYFNITSLVLVCITVFNILEYKNKIPKDNSPKDNSSHINLTLEVNKPKPDIYYIVLDAYPRADILRKYYNYDNSPFLEGLESLGFNVLEKSQSNYDLTQYSIYSTLEMEYIDKVFNSQKEWLWKINTNGLKYTNALRIFYKNGYKTTAFKKQSYLTNLDNSPYITSVLENNSGYNQFDDLLLKSTIFRAIYRFIPFARYRHRDKQLFILDSLPKFTQKKGPNFVFAHILCPHVPLVFAENGDLVNWPRFSNNIFILRDKSMIAGKYFCDQVTYLNNRILRVVQSI